jgi:hypothetical protein
MTTTYLPLNPFLSSSVGEAELWGSREWLDVPSIHAYAATDLNVMVEMVRATKRTRVRFVRGAGGAGKSHLFTRLRRHAGDTIFYAYVPNPPLQSETLEAFVLGRLIASLRHPARHPNGGASTYSQLRLLAYALLRPVVEQDVSLSQLHEAWSGIAMEEKKDLLHQALLLLEADFPSVPRSVLRAILTVLRDDKEALAAQWLAGATYLTEADLKYLGVPEALRREDCAVVIQLLGKLSARVGMPFVLVMDQLDLIASSAQLDEFQRLLFSLIDQSENWAVFIGLVAERFTAWDAGLTQALRGRIGVPDSSAPLGFLLPVTDVLPIGGEDKKALLLARLKSPALAAQRAKDGITSELHPLTDGDLTRLTQGGAVFPRHLIAAAGDVYEKALSTPAPVAAPAPVVVTPEVAKSAPVAAAAAPAPMAVSPPPDIPGAKQTLTSAPQRIEKPTLPVTAPLPASVVVTPPAIPTPPPQPIATAAAPARPALAAKVDELLQKHLLEGHGETTVDSAVELGQRVKDLIEVMAGQPVDFRDSDMGKNFPGFDGSDFTASWNGGQVRVVTTNAMRNSFIAVLERLQEVAGRTILLRHAAAAVTGQLTMEMLNAFKAKNTFHHLASTESALLGALGRLLASLREGIHNSLHTEPPATPANIREALRKHPLLSSCRTWEHLQKIQTHAEKPVMAAAPAGGVLSSIANGTPAKPKPPVPESPAAKPPAFVVAPPLPPVTEAVSTEAKPPAAPVVRPLATPPGKPVAKPIRPPVNGKLPPPSKPEG